MYLQLVFWAISGAKTWTSCQAAPKSVGLASGKWRVYALKSTVWRWPMDDHRPHWQRNIRGFTSSLSPSTSYSPDLHWQRNIRGFTSYIFILLDNLDIWGFPWPWGDPKMNGVEWKIPLKWMIGDDPYFRKNPYSILINGPKNNIVACWQDLRAMIPQILPSGNFTFLPIENGHLSVDLPIKMGMFQFANCKRLPEMFHDCWLDTKSDCC